MVGYVEQDIGGSNALEDLKMNSLIIALSCAAVFVAGVVGITLSVPLQAPAMILLGLAAIVAALGLLRGQTTEMAREKRSADWLLALVFISIGYFVTRACLSPVWDLGVEDLMLIVSAGILYLIAGYAVTGKSGILLRQCLAWVMVVLLLLHVGAAAMQLNGGEGYSAAYYFTGVGRSSPENVTGMYSYYGSFANFAVIAGLLCLSLGVWGRLSVMLRVMMCLWGVVVLALALWSQSRSAALSLIPALVVFGVLLLVSLSQHSTRVRRRASKVMVSLGVCGLLAGGVAAAWVFQNRGGASIDEISYSGVRIHYWAMAADQWADFPIVGAGSRSFSYESFRYWSPNLGTNEANPEFVHNEYLQLLADYGLVGLLLILVLFGWHFYRGGKQVHMLAEKMGESGLKRGSNAMALAVAGMSGMTAMAVHICFDYRTHLLANLLLLVSCAVWVLPVAKSTVSLSGGPGAKESKMGSLVLGLVLLAAGLGAVGLGGQQLWAGMPLLKNKMAKEDGSWQPTTVNRGVWIPAFEESLMRAPQWRRYQRLGTFYWYEAYAGEEVDEVVLHKAELAYLASLERHSTNPIPKINLANIYRQTGRWEEADAMYASASEMAQAREGWFLMHAHWAALHLNWAVYLWEQKQFDDVELHFKRAKQLYKESYKYGYYFKKREYIVEYTKALIVYADFLNEQKRFADAELQYEEGRQQGNWYLLDKKSKLSLAYARHLYLFGMDLWYARKPQEAYQLFVKARSSMNHYKAKMQGQVDQSWLDQMKKIQEVIDFLENAGVGK